MSKRNLIMIVIIVVVVAAAAFLLARKANSNSPYSVVYLSTGEVYVGELVTFPDFELKNGYILQVAKDEKDPAKSNFQLNPVNQALWAPSSMHFIRDNVVFYGRLAPGSKIAETIAA